MVGKDSRDRRTSSSTSPSTKRRISSSTTTTTTTTTNEKKKTVKPLGICSFCLGDEDKNAEGVPEDMISCAECGNCGHPSCLKYSDRLVKKIKTTRWQCLDCKRCIICHKGDDSLLFCDFCDAAIHPKCCRPPLNHVPKGEFACQNCRDDGTVKQSEKKTLTRVKSSSTRPVRNKNEKLPKIISRSVSQLIDGMSNFFLPKKDKKTNHQRQQSVQKAMKILRNKTKSTNTKLLKRSHSSAIDKNKILAKNILAASKTVRVRRKPSNLLDESPSNLQIPIKRRSSNKKSLISEQIDPLRSTTKRKSSISSITQTSSTTKKRLKQEIKSSDEQQTDDDNEQTKPTVTKRKLNLDLSKYQTPPSFLKDSLPDTINANDVYLFLDARKTSSKLISDCSEQFRHSIESIEDETNNTRWPPYIVFGGELIKTWYSSSYPQEYARVPRLFICEFCLKYMKCEQVYDRHRKKCETFHPPANEIYHKDDLSVFEVDGNINRIYCQNLCLLAKLFLDHKTLYYDVEPFLFYVLTRNDSNGCHFLGYFSKEKHCPQKYNLSCITVLPNCQRRGYGRFLIELSYLLSQKEGQIGTPERPLSYHGAKTYETYWNMKIAQQLVNYYYKKKEFCLLKDLMNETGMAIDDILDTLQNLRVLTMKSNEKPVLHIDVNHLEILLKNEKLKHENFVSLDNEFLRFTPALKPLIIFNDDNSIDDLNKKFEIIFKRIESENFEQTIGQGESNDPINTTEIVRYVRRRKFGRKRRSIYVKCRVSSKNEVNSSNNDDHSQEYIARRRDSTKEDEDVDEEKPTDIVKSPSKQITYKQLTIDQFLTKIPSDTSKKSINSSNISPIPKSETDSTKISNGTSEETGTKSLLANNQDLLTRQISDGTISSSNDSSSTPISSPLPFKKRAWTSSNLQTLVDPVSSSKV